MATGNDDYRALDALRDRHAGAMDAIMKTMQITLVDVGKFFVLNKDRATGQIVTRAAMLDMDISSISGWTEVSEFEVNNI